MPFTVGEWTNPPLTKGDVNMDGTLDVDDVSLLIKVVLESGEFNEIGDMNNDGEIDIEDISLLINAVLGK